MSKSLLDLLQGDNGQKILMALVVLAGGGNLWQGTSAEKENRADFDKAITEIHSIHGAYNESIDRQKHIETMLKKLTGEPTP
jgi:hypothetical protein